MKLKLSAFLFLFLLCRLSFAATYAIVLSGGADADDNFYRYFDNTKKVYSALRTTGLSSDNIQVLYADGTSGVNTTKSNPLTFYLTSNKIAPGTSLVAGEENNINGAATRENFSHAIEDLSKKVKDGDNVLIFITDHGSQDDGAVLWGWQILRPEHLSQELNKLPKSTNIQVVTNMCFGGQMIRAASENTCVMSNTDDSHFSNSWANSDIMAQRFSEKIISDQKEGKKTRTIDAFNEAKSKDWMNKRYTTSLDEYIYQELSKVPSLQPSSCDISSQSPIRKLQTDILDISGHLASSEGSSYDEKLKSRLADLNQELKKYYQQDSNGTSEYFREKYQKQLLDLQKNWDSLSSSEKEKRRPEMTLLVEKIREEDSQQSQFLNSVESEIKRTELEIRFLKQATPKQIETYNKIKRCLAHEI